MNTAIGSVPSLSKQNYCPPLYSFEVEIKPKTYNQLPGESRHAMHCSWILKKLSYIKSEEAYQLDDEEISLLRALRLVRRDPLLLDAIVPTTEKPNEHRQPKREAVVVTDTDMINLITTFVVENNKQQNASTTRSTSHPVHQFSPSKSSTTMGTTGFNHMPLIKSLKLEHAESVDLVKSQQTCSNPPVSLPAISSVDSNIPTRQPLHLVRETSYLKSTQSWEEKQKMFRETSFTRKVLLQARSDNHHLIRREKTLASMYSLPVDAHRQDNPRSPPAITNQVLARKVFRRLKSRGWSGNYLSWLLSDNNNLGSNYLPKIDELPHNGENEITETEMEPSCSSVNYENDDAVLSLVQQWNVLTLD